MKPQTNKPAVPPRHPFWSGRWSARGILITASVAFLLGYPMYAIIMEKIDSGIYHEGDLLVVNLKSMSSFEMDQDSGTNEEIPAVYRSLDGKRVRLVGQMYSPMAGEGSVKSFVLVYSIMNCCFSGPPKVQHLVQATVLPGKRVEIAPTSGYVEVTGMLHVGVVNDAGHVQSVYRLDVEKVVSE